MSKRATLCSTRLSFDARVLLPMSIGEESLPLLCEYKADTSVTPGVALRNGGISLTHYSSCLFLQQIQSLKSPLVERTSLCP